MIEQGLAGSDCIANIDVSMDGLDIDAAFEDALMLPDAWRLEGEREGRVAGLQDDEAYLLGVRKGRELGREAGFVAGCCVAMRELAENDPPRWERVRATVEQMERALESIDWSDAGDVRLSACMETARAKYRQACAILKLEIKPAEEQNELF